MELGSTTPTMTEDDLEFAEEVRRENERDRARQNTVVVHDCTDYESDEDIHLLMSTDGPDSYTSYEEFANRYQLYFNHEDNDAYYFIK